MNSLRQLKTHVSEPYTLQLNSEWLAVNSERLAHLPDTNKTRARRDLISERVPDLSSSKWQLALVKFQQAFEIKEDSLSSFGPQIAARNQLEYAD